MSSAILATTGVVAGSHLKSERRKVDKVLESCRVFYSESVGQPIFVDSCIGELTGHGAHYPTIYLPQTYRMITTPFLGQAEEQKSRVGISWVIL